MKSNVHRLASEACASQLSATDLHPRPTHAQPWFLVLLLRLHPQDTLATSICQTTNGGGGRQDTLP